MYDPVATARVTLRDMLSHRTGVPRQDFLKVNAPDRRTDLVERIRYFEPAQEFRTGFRYCNEVVTVAGDLLARRAGTHVGRDAAPRISRAARHDAHRRWTVAG